MIITFAGYVPNLWICDLLSQFRLVYLGVLLLCVCVSLILRSKTISLICMAALILDAAPVALLMVPRHFASMLIALSESAMVRW
jgi:hypothetical protein